MDVETGGRTTGASPGDGSLRWRRAFGVVAVGGDSGGRCVIGLQRGARDGTIGRLVWLVPGDPCGVAWARCLTGRG